MFFITTRNKFKYAVSIILLAVLNSSGLSMANPIEQPVIAFAVTSCNSAYLIRLFENGKIEYRGSYGVKTLGRHENKISPQAVEDLLKKFADAGSFSVMDDSLESSFMVEAIYLRQNNKTAIFSESPLSSFLREQILRVTNASQWFDYSTPCKKTYSPVGRNPFKDYRIVKVNQLKSIND